MPADLPDSGRRLGRTFQFDKSRVDRRLGARRGTVRHQVRAASLRRRGYRKSRGTLVGRFPASMDPHVADPWSFVAPELGGLRLGMGYQIRPCTESFGGKDNLGFGYVHLRLVRLEGGFTCSRFFAAALESRVQGIALSRAAMMGRPVTSQRP